MRLRFANFASTTLTAAIEYDATTLNVDDASSFPTLTAGQKCRVTLYDGEQDPEIVEVTSIVGNVLTVTRGAESTAACGWNAGTKIRLAPTAEAFESLFSRLEVLWCGLAVGTANDLVLTPSEDIDGLEDGQVFAFVTGAAANTGAVTVTIGSAAAVDLLLSDCATALDAGDLPANTFVIIGIYDGDAILIQPQALSSVLSGTSLQITGDAILNNLTVNGIAQGFDPSADADGRQFATTAWVLDRIAEFASPSVLDFTDTVTVPNNKSFASYLSGGSTDTNLIKINVAGTLSVGDTTTGAITFYTTGGGLISMAVDGTMTVVSPGAADDSQKVATTEWVNDAIGSAVGGGFAPLASPAFTGTPTAPTATAGTNTTQVATTEFTTTAVANGVASASAKHGFQNFTASGSFTVPSGVTSICVEGQAPGGGGAGKDAYGSTGYSGGNGGTLVVGALVTLTGGTGGTSGGLGAANAGVGGNYGGQTVINFGSSAYRGGKGGGLLGGFEGYDDGTIHAGANGGLGSGGGGSVGAAQGGGGAGQYLPPTTYSVTPGATITITFGTAGTGGGAGDYKGGNGGGGWLKIIW